MKTSEKLRFSIVIPAFNEAHYIADTIDSLKKQNYRDKFEIIVVDNGSTDQTAVIAKSLGAKVFTELNPGVCWARDKGTREAQGEIVISTDADTIYAKDWLNKIDEEFKRNPKVVGVAGPCRFMGGPMWGAIYPYILFGFISFIYKISHKTLYITATNFAFKKSVWSGYNTAFNQGGDELDLLRQTRAHGRVVFLNNNPTFTSARRLTRGLIYNFFVTFLLFYFVDYVLTKIFKKSVLGNVPKFRNELSPNILSVLHVFWVIFLIGIFSLYTKPGHFLIKESQKTIIKTDHAKNRVIDRVERL